MQTYLQIMIIYACVKKKVSAKVSLKHCEMKVEIRIHFQEGIHLFILKWVCSEKIRLSHDNENKILCFYKNNKEQIKYDKLFQKIVFDLSDQNDTYLRDLLMPRCTIITKIFSSRQPDDLSDEFDKQ